MPRLKLLTAISARATGRGRTPRREHIDVRLEREVSRRGLVVRERRGPLARLGVDRSEDGAAQDEVRAQHEQKEERAEEGQ
eukprot:5595236-Prymnesium_polylepis.1